MFVVGNADYLETTGSPGVKHCLGTLPCFFLSFCVLTFLLILLLCLSLKRLGLQVPIQELAPSCSLLFGTLVMKSGDLLLGRGAGPAGALPEKEK